MRVRITAFSPQSHFSCDISRSSLVGQVVEITLSPDRDARGDNAAGYFSAYVLHRGHPNPPGEWCKGLLYADQPVTSQENQAVQINGIELYPDGAYKVTRSQLSPTQIAAALKASANEQSTTIHNAFGIAGQPVRIMATQNRITAGVRITALQIGTYFVVQDGYLVPTFTNEGISVSGAVQVRCTWNAPETMRLYVAVNMCYGAGAYQANDAVTLLFAKGPNGHPVGYFRLPLPNTYQDSRICLGREFTNNGSTIEAVLKNSLRQLREGTWNTDLMDYCNQTNARKLFRFDPSTLVSVPPTGDWWNLCDKCSRVEMDQITIG